MSAPTDETAQSRVRRQQVGDLTRRLCGRVAPKGPEDIQERTRRAGAIVNEHVAEGLTDPDPIVMAFAIGRLIENECDLEARMREVVVKGDWTLTRAGSDHAWKRHDPTWLDVGRFCHDVGREEIEERGDASVWFMVTGCRPTRDSRPDGGILRVEMSTHPF